MHFMTQILIYISTVTMVTSSQVIGSSSHFIKWREHGEYKLPVTSVEFTFKAKSKLECAIVFSARSGLEPCAGFAFVSIKDQWTCALAIKVTMVAGCVHAGGGRGFTPWRFVNPVLNPSLFLFVYLIAGQAIVTMDQL